MHVAITGHTVWLVLSVKSFIYVKHVCPYLVEDLGSEIYF